jgi:hypothetical protein
MKFFTPDLLLRFGSLDDAIAHAAQEEWEEVNRKYLDHLEKIRPKLPRGVRSLLRNFCLHDAGLLALGLQQDHRELFLVLAFDGPDKRGLMLTYDLTSRPELIRHPSLSEEGTPIEWLYDELEVVKGGKQPVFAHSILFTGGRELRLTFRNLRLAVFERVLAPREGSERDLDALLVG